MTKHRPIGVTILAILAAVVAILNIIHTLQMLHLFPIQSPIALGPSVFFSFSLIGAIMYGILALIWIWLTKGLWALDEQSWLFVVVLSILDLIILFVNLLGGATFADIWLPVALLVIILIYCMTPGVQKAFGRS